MYLCYSFCLFLVFDVFLSNEFSIVLICFLLSDVIFGATILVIWYDFPDVTSYLFTILVKSNMQSLLNTSFRICAMRVYPITMYIIFFKNKILKIKFKQNINTWKYEYLSYSVDKIADSLAKHETIKIILKAQWSIIYPLILI